MVKNLALMTYVSVGCASAPVLEFLEEWSTESLEEIAPSVIPKSTKIFVNGAAGGRAGRGGAGEWARGVGGGWEYLGGELLSKSECWCGHHLLLRACLLALMPPRASPIPAWLCPCLLRRRVGGDPPRPPDAGAHAALHAAAGGHQHRGGGGARHPTTGAHQGEGAGRVCLHVLCRSLCTIVLGICKSGYSALVRDNGSV